MDNFLSGFADELLSGGHVKEGLDPAARNEILRRNRGLIRGAGGTLGAGLLYKMMDPDVSLGRAITTGGALTGGGMLGRHVARSAGLGNMGRGMAGLVGSIAGVRALRRLSKKKSRED